jgi:hypothetical protein
MKPFPSSLILVSEVFTSKCHYQDGMSALSCCPNLYIHGFLLHLLFEFVTDLFLFYQGFLLVIFSWRLAFFPKRQIIRCYSSFGWCIQTEISWDLLSPYYFVVVPCWTISIEEIFVRIIRFYLYELVLDCSLASFSLFRVFSSIRDLYRNMININVFNFRNALGHCTISTLAKMLFIHHSLSAKKHQCL